jgi:hypothetical protein
VVEAIQDQWAIVTAVVVLVVAAIVWVYAKPHTGESSTPSA